MAGLIIAVDFDGTLVEHKFPAIGDEVPGAIVTLRDCVSLGARIILWTMRSDGMSGGDLLTAAVEWLRERGVEPWGVNVNPEQDWSGSPKAYAQVYIDDAGLGIPLIKSPTGGRPMVDWRRIRPILIELCERTR
jgi:hypothetical protein